MIVSENTFSNCQHDFDFVERHEWSFPMFCLVRPFLAW